MKNAFVRLVAVLICAAGSPTGVIGCTLWGAVQEKGAGTLISKNRDWKPDHTQVLKLRRDSKRYAYFGLYAEGNAEPGLKEGVNEKGLCVVTASSCIPRAVAKEQSSQPGVMPVLLAGYATCDQILADQKKLFSDRRPCFLLISDRAKLLTVEIGMKGEYAVKETAVGAVAHTNHYLTESMKSCNSRAGRSTTTRLHRINELLSRQPHTVATFAAMSRDQHDGVDNSLWRTGTKTATLSSWILEAPAVGPLRLQIVIANPGQREQSQSFVLDAAFWAAPAGPVSGRETDGD
jgi:isopenicillin-N N-acyltransferase like protein